MLSMPMGRRSEGPGARGELVADALALLAIGFVALAFFYPVIIGGAYLPAGGGDLASFLFPMYRFIAASMSSGDIPLWNPHQYAGAPLAADNQSGMFYPANLLLFLAWPSFAYWALEALVIAHVCWAGAGAYLAFRLWRPNPVYSRLAALLGAVAFMLSDVFVTHVGNLNLVAVASWLPLAMLGVNRSIEAQDSRSRVRWTLVSGAAIGLSALAGHGQATFLVTTLVVLYVAYRLVTDRNRRPVFVLVGTGLVALGLSAIGVLPAIAGREHTVRASFSYEESLRYAIPPRALVGLVAPQLYGRGPARFVGDWDRVEVGYVGVVTLLFAAVALIEARDRRTLFLAIAGILSLLLAMGPATPLHRWLLSPLSLPFQAPARFVLLTDFCLCFLAAVGADYALRMAQPRLTGVLGGLALGSIAVLGVLYLAIHGGEVSLPPESSGVHESLLAFGLAAVAGISLLMLRDRGWLGPVPFGAAAVVLVAAELVWLGHGVEVSSEDPTAGFRRAEAARFLQADEGLHRIDTATAAWQPGAAQMLGLYDIGGVYNPLQLGLYKYYADGLRFRGSEPYNLLGVKYIVADKTSAPSDRDFIHLASRADPHVDVYRNERAVGRIGLYSDLVIEEDDAASYELLHTTGFDPRTTLVLSQQPAGLEVGSPTGTADPERAGIATLRSYGPDEVVVSVATERPALLLLTDVYHPDWRAWVDGEPVEVLRADFAFRAVAVSEGEHEVRMSLEPAHWRVGAAITALSIALLCLAAACAFGSARRAEAHAAMS